MHNIFILGILEKQMMDVEIKYTLLNSVLPAAHLFSGPA